MTVKKFPDKTGAIDPKPKSEKPNLSGVHNSLERAHSLALLLETADKASLNQNAIVRVIQTIRLEIEDAAALIEMIREKEEIALHGDLKPK